MAIHQAKIGTYNINNFFDRFDDPYSTGDDRWGPRTTRPKKLEQIFDLGARLREDKPDILALQEVENKGALYEFNKAHLGDHFDDLVVVEGNDPRGIQIGIASRFPIGQIVSYQFLRDVGEERKGKIFSRDLLEVEILDPDEHIPVCTIFTTHLKSKYVPDNLSGAERDEARQKSDYRRSRQAMAVAQIIKRRFSNPQTGLFMVMGDFNDTPDSDALYPLLGDRDLNLYDVLDELPDDKRWTHYWSGGKEYSQIDYILLSSAMRQRLIPDTVKVIHRGHTQGSDHKPVYANVWLGWDR